MVNKVTQNWFLLALAACFWVGYQFAGTIAVALQWPFLRTGIVFSVMMLMGLTLQADAIRRSLSRPTAAIISIASNTLLVPLLALPTYFWLPPDQFGGLFVASLIPCTLASASVWTRKAGGDDSIAILTTVVTNLACFIVVPVGLALVLTQQSEVSAGNQIAKLASIVVAPLVVAQILRRIRIAGRPIAAWADEKKITLSALAQLGILLMVMMGAAQSVVTVNVDAIDQAVGSPSPAVASAVSWVVLIGSVLGVHLTAMGIAIGLAGGFGVPRPGQIACGISGSQKTLMVGLQIAIDCGVSVLPMMIYHAGQLLIDTVVVNFWKNAKND